MTLAKIVLLFGGSSGERFVSVATAQNLVTVLPEAEPWFLTLEGAVSPVSRAQVVGHAEPFTAAFRLAEPPRFPSVGAALDSLVGADLVVVLGLHGGEGENGTLQAELERRKLSFTASGSAASANAFDKEKAKALVKARGVRTAAAEHFAPSSAQVLEQGLKTAFAQHGRLVLKPVADGSSVGLHHLKEAAQIPEIARAIAKVAIPYLAEEFISGTELTVGVVENLDGSTRALPVSEIRVVPGGAFDYQGKYLGKGTQELTPAEVPESVAAEAREVARTAHAALGCRGYSRTDVIAGEKGVVFLEINTLPGMTRASFIPQQLAAEGTPFRKFLDDQIALARK